MKLENCLLFGGKQSEIPKGGMLDLLGDFTTERSALAWMLDNDITKNTHWYSLYDPETQDVYITNPYRQLSAFVDNPLVSLNSDHYNDQAVSALDKFVDSEGFDYKYTLLENIKLCVDDGAPERLVDCTVRYINNRNKKQLLVVSYKDGNAVRQKEMVVNEKYEIKPATELELLELMG